jgi:E3 ubiquitin-protein ligase HERC2
MKVVDVACGSGDAQTLAVTSNGAVYSWGDGDYGKLGRGGSESCKTPKVVQQLENVFVEKVYCGAQFSLALSRDGEVYSWGKGEHYRLGHGSVEHVRFPKKIEGLVGRFVKSLSVGSSHVLALTDTGEIYGWGRNDQGQLGDLVGTYVTEPVRLTGLKGRQIVGMACGPSQSFVWSTNNRWNVEPHVPFVVDVSQSTLMQISALLDHVWEGIDGESERPPSKEKECIVVAALNLLKLQLYSILSHTFDLHSLGLSPGHELLVSLRQKVVALASQPGVLPSIQSVAQLTLQVGWSLLLPTADERARALSTSLPLTTDPSSIHSGRKFMTDLLVSSLTADGGLENALETAIKFEVEDSEKRSSCTHGRVSPFADDYHQRWLSEQAQQEIEAKRTSTEQKRDVQDAHTSESGDHGLSLLNLIHQLLKSSGAVTLSQLNELPANLNILCSANNTASTSVMTKVVQSSSSLGGTLGAPTTSSCSGYGSLEYPAIVSKHVPSANMSDRSPSLSLLLRFQRLIVSRIFSVQNNLRTGGDVDGKYCKHGLAVKKIFCITSS